MINNNYNNKYDNKETETLVRANNKLFSQNQTQQHNNTTKQKHNNTTKQKHNKKKKMVSVNFEESHRDHFERANPRSNHLAEGRHDLQ